MYSGINAFCIFPESSMRKECADWHEHTYSIY